MNLIYTILGTPLGWIIWAIYQVIHSYGWSLIIFTIILRLVQVPFAIKQQKSSARMGALQPKMAEINKKYANNPQKRQEELMKLQQEYGYNPMSGCLPMAIPFIILFGMIDVVYKPLTHILHLSSDVIQQAANIIGNTGNMMTQQLSIISQVQASGGAEKFAALGPDVIEKIQNLDLNFLGINLGSVPLEQIQQGIIFPLILLPVLAGVFSFLQMFVSMKMNPMSMEAAGGAGCSMKVMMYIMPIFSIWITCTVPAGVGSYWIISYLIGLVQVIVLNKFYNPKRLREEAKAEMEAKRKSKKTTIKEEIKIDGETVVKEKQVSQKEWNRQRLAAARKADAEKYGEEYIDVTDDDLLS